MPLFGRSSEKQSDKSARKAFDNLSTSAKDLLYGPDKEQDLTKQLDGNGIIDICAAHPNFLVMSHKYKVPSELKNNGGSMVCKDISFIPIVQFTKHEVPGIANFISKHPHVNFLYDLTIDDFGSLNIDPRKERNPQIRLAILENMAAWSNINNDKHDSLFTYNAMNALYKDSDFELTKDNYNPLSQEEMDILFAEGEHHIYDIAAHARQQIKETSKVSVRDAAQLIYHYMDTEQHKGFQPQSLNHNSYSDNGEFIFNSYEGERIEAPQEAVDLLGYYYHEALSGIAKSISIQVMSPKEDVNTLDELIKTNKRQLHRLTENIKILRPMLPESLIESVCEAADYIDSAQDQLPDIAVAIRSQHAIIASAKKVVETQSIPAHLTEKIRINALENLTGVHREALRFMTLMSELDTPIHQRNLDVLEQAGYEVGDDRAELDKINIPALLKKPHQIGPEDDMTPADDPVSRGYALHRGLCAHSVNSDIDEQSLAEREEQAREGVQEQITAIETQIDVLKHMRDGLSAILDSKPREQIKSAVLLTEAVVAKRSNER